MWIASKLGFYSIVQKGGTFHVRARARKDLLNLVAATSSDLGPGQISESPEADYRWRIVLPAEDMKPVWDALAASVDYPNFKSQIASTPDQRDKLPIYHEIWHLLYDYQQSDPR